MTHPWDLPAREITPESAVLSRRRWLKRVGLGAVGLAAASAGAGLWWWNAGGDDDVLNAGKVTTPADLFPAVRNARFELDRPLTNEAAAARYCNFYEFSSTKQVWRWVRAVPTRPLGPRSRRTRRQAPDFGHRRYASYVRPFPGGTRLPSPLRRGVGHGRALDRRPAGRPAAPRRTAAGRPLRPLHFLRPPRPGEPAGRRRIRGRTPRG